MNTKCMISWIDETTSFWVSWVKGDKKILRHGLEVASICRVSWVRGVNKVKQFGPVFTTLRAEKCHGSHGFNHKGS